MHLRKIMFAYLKVIGICVVLAGIAIELTMKVNMGFVLITVGSVVIAGGSILCAKIARGGKG